MRTVAVALLALAALTGCSSQPGSATAVTSAPSSTATPTPSLTALGSVGTVSQLKDAAIEAGYDCPTWKQSNHIARAAESGSCSDADVFSVYTSASDRDEIVAFLRDTASEDIPTKLLVGDNWIINSPDASSLEPNLGGVVVSAP